jgi:hypothetical protein
MKSDFREFKTVEIEDYNSEELDKNVEYIPVKNKLIEETETDYEKISIEEILKFHKIPIYTEAETQPIFSECLNVNQYYKFYLAKNSHLKNCSLMVLNNVDTKKRTFGLLLENLCRLDSLDCKFILKLKGANVINNTKVYLLFDLIMGSYLKKKKEDDVSFNYKFCILYYLIETVFVLHDNLIPAEDLRFSLFNIDNYEELKFLPPFGKH